MNPERVGVRDLVEPLGVRAARVDLDRETKRRDQDRLVFVEIVFVDVTLEIRWDGIFGPTPTAHRRRVEFETAARRRKAAFDFAVYVDAHQAPSVFVSIRRWQRNDVWTGGFW